MKELYIVTGPPGSPCLDYAETLGGEIYEQSLGNKSLWRDHKRGTGPAILVTAAPAHDAKEFWLTEARRYGFVPTLLLLDPGRPKATKWLTQGKDLTETQKKRLARTVQRWYTAYEPHPVEKTVTNYACNQSVPTSKVG